MNKVGAKRWLAKQRHKSQTGHEGMEHDESGNSRRIGRGRKSNLSRRKRRTIQTDHMPGMMGATGEVVGAFDSIAYEIT